MNNFDYSKTPIRITHNGLVTGGNEGDPFCWLISEQEARNYRLNNNRILSYHYVQNVSALSENQLNRLRMIQCNELYGYTVTNRHELYPWNVTLPEGFNFFGSNTIYYQYTKRDVLTMGKWYNRRNKGDQLLLEIYNGAGDDDYLLRVVDSDRLEIEIRDGDVWWNDYKNDIYLHKRTLISIV
jgi:hypothetical protein